MSIPFVLIVGGVVVTLLAILLFAFSGTKRVKVPIVVAIALGGLALGAALGMFGTSPDGDDLPYVAMVTPRLGMTGGVMAVLAIGVSLFVRTWRFKAPAMLAGGIGGFGLGVSLGIAAMLAYSDTKPVNENDANITSNPLTNAERNAFIAKTQAEANGGGMTKGAGGGGMTKGMGGGAMMKGMGGGGMMKGMGGGPTPKAVDGGPTPKEVDGGPTPPATNDPEPTPKKE